DFIHSPDTYRTGQSFRVVCSKKQKDFAIIIKGDIHTKKRTINAMLPKYYCVTWVYFDMSDNNKQVIAKFIKNLKHFYVNNEIVNLNDWMADVIAASTAAKRKQNGRFAPDDYDLCPTAMADGFEDWVRNEIIANDKTMIYKKGGTRGTCSCCGRKVKYSHSQRVRQYEMCYCPNCGSRCMAILENSSSLKASVVNYVTTIQKGEQNTVWFRTFRIIRDNNTAYPQPIANYLSEIQRNGIRGNRVALWGLYGQSWVYDADYTWCCYKFYPGNIDSAVNGTRLQYADIYNYAQESNSNVIQYAKYFAQYPVMEFLRKGGYTQLLLERVCGLSKDTANAIRWQRSKLKECFKFPLHFLKSRPAGDWTMSDIATLNHIYAANPKISINDAIYALIDKCIPRDKKLIDVIFAYCGPKKVTDYINLTAQTDGNENIRFTWYTYRDYITECQKLNYNLKDKNILYPKDLKAAHNQTMSLIEISKDKYSNEQLQKQADKLNKWCYAADNLIIRPAASVEDFVTEGNDLHHCVKTYIDRVISGDTAIFLIRQADQPNKPYFTLELRNKKIMQCRTKNNQDYRDYPEIVNFISEWLTTIVNKTKTKNQNHTKAA
ncbi:MAG: PcfJ domain-containing protein, partial [Clostridiales bacterium]